MIRFPLFFAAVVIIGVGFLSIQQLDRQAGLPLLLGALTLGGGFLICGLFSLKMLWHGLIGAGILALLGVGRGLLNLPDFAAYLAGERTRGSAPALEFAVLAICAFVLARVWIAFKKERTRRTLEGS